MMPSPNTNMPALQRIFACATVESTRALGDAIGRLAYPGLVVALHGNLGAGKTTLTQGIAHGLGITAQVTSPTFTLVNEYSTPAGWRFVHIDTYRLGDATATPNNTASPNEAIQEASTFGLEEILEEAVTPDAFGATPTVVVIEWAERVAALLPATLLTILLEQAAGDGRLCTCTAYGAAAAALLETINLPEQAT